jgi:hypothetical protein
MIAIGKIKIDFISYINTLNFLRNCMKRLLYIFLLISPFVSEAQIFEFGTGASFTKFAGQVYSKDVQKLVKIEDSPQLTFNAIFSANIPIKYLRPEVVVGVNPTAALSLFYSTVALDIPILATIKLGAGSSEQSDGVLGLGFGMGGQVSLFSTYMNASFAPVPYSGVMILPIVSGETSVIFRRYNMYKLRVDITPVPLKRINKNFVGDISQINIRLLRSFL